MANMALMIKGEYNVGVVILLGMGIVFAGLVCIVILCVLMGKVVRLLEGKSETKAEAPAPAVAAAPAAPVAEAIPNRRELVAAIACCLAEELGTDVSAIRIVSLKKV